jgi:signal transduction histidine kinase
MLLRKAVAAAAVLGALAVLIGLVWKTQQQPLSVAQASLWRAALEHSAEQVRQIDAEITRLRLAQDTNLGRLGQHLDAWQRADKRWQSLNQAGLAGLPAASSRYAQNAAQGQQHLNQLVEAQTSFVTAFDEFQSAAEATLARMTAAGNGTKAQQLIGRLVEELARYSLQSRPDNGANISALANRLPAVETNLAEAVRRLRNARDQLQTTNIAWKELALEAQLLGLEQQLGQALAQQEAEQRTYTVALAAFAGALMLVFGLIALRLQSSMHALDQINSNLEQTVEERTRELKMQQAHLIQSEKMASLGQMVAGVAHEINTPLGYASSNVESVKQSLTTVAADTNLSEDAQDRLEEADVLLEDAMHGMAQIDELVKSLKNFSRVDRSHTELFDINDGLDTALKICRNTLKDQIEVVRDYAGGLPQIVCAPSQLNQVFLNLINNAAQAMAGGGTLTLSSQRDEDHIDIRICDTGCGMDADTQAHIFEPFFTTKPVGEGTGLGLSIVFRIIEDHAGRIAVESTPGQGTQFHIRLPIRQHAQAPSSGSAVIIDDEAEPAHA